MLFETVGSVITNSPLANIFYLMIQQVNRSSIHLDKNILKHDKPCHDVDVALAMKTSRCVP